MPQQVISNRLYSPFRDFLKTEQASGIILIACTLISLALTNSPMGEAYAHLWHSEIGVTGFGAAFSLPLEMWINDGLMALFFLVVGLEIKRELITGELSSVKKATLPIFSALGGMVVPAFIYYIINKGSGASEHGWGIPMATDIAFALGILSMLGKRVPMSLKVFLTALAVVDDLGAIIVIAVAYTQNMDLHSLYAAFGVFGFLLMLNYMGVRSVVPYLLFGFFMWFFMLQSGVHATIAGVLAAIAIPMNEQSESISPAQMLQHNLHQFTSFVIMPLFALANTCILFDTNIGEIYESALGLGIIFGLFIGKPLGIVGFSMIAIKLGLASKSPIPFAKILGVGCLGGIGFTMSIFISLLAFSDVELQNFAKIAVLTASAISGIVGYMLIYNAKEPIPEAEEEK